MKLLAPAMVLAKVGRQRCRPKPSRRKYRRRNRDNTTEQFTVTNYYKQDVYDRFLNFVGTVDAVLIDQREDHSFNHWGRGLSRYRSQRLFAAIRKGSDGQEKR